MAENTEKKALVDVEINAIDALKNLAELRVKADELRDAQGKLDKSTEAGRLQYEALGQQIKAISKEAQGYQKEIQSNIKYQNEQGGSLQQLKYELSLNTAAYNKLSEAERNGAKGTALQSHILGLTNKLKDAENALGNHRRSVGDYGIAGAALAKEIEKLAQKLDTLTGEGKAGSAEFAAFKQQMDALNSTLAATGQEGTSIRSQIKELTETLVQMKLNGQDNTEVFQQMNAKLAEMKDAMGDVQQGASGLASDTSKLDAATSIISGLTTSFGAYASAVGFSAETEKEAKEAMKLMTVAMTALATVTQMQNLTQKQSIAYQTAENILKKIGIDRTLLAAKAEASYTAMKSGGTAATKAISTATWLWNKALLANPVIFIATALVGLIFAVTKLTNAFSASAQAERSAAEASKMYERQVVKTSAAVEKANAKQRAAAATLEVAAKEEIAALKKADAEKRAIYNEDGKLVEYLSETEEQRIAREMALKKEIAEVEQRLVRDTAAAQMVASTEITNQKKDELNETKRRLEEEQKLLAIYLRKKGEDSEKYKEQEKKVNDLLQKQLVVETAILDEVVKIQQAQASLKEAEVKGMEEQLKAAEDAKERGYQITLSRYKREQQLSEAGLKAEAGYLSKKFSDKQDYEQKMFTLSESSSMKQLKLQRDNKKITEEEYKAQLAMLASERKEFNDKQAVAANEYYIQQVAAIKKLMGDNLTEQIADVERQYKEAVKQLGEIKPPTQKGLSDEEFKAQTAAYEAMVMKQTETEIVLGREKDKKIAELRKNSLQARAAEVEKAFTDEYQDDFDKYADNEREKLRVTIEMLQKQIEKKREAGLSTAADEAKLRSAQSGATQLELAQDLQRANLSAKQRYDLKMAALDKEQELYKDNADKINEIERYRTETERELTLSRIEAVEQWASRSMEVANELNNLMNALNEAALQEAQDEADQKTAASDERRAAEQAKLDAEMKQNEARMQKDAKYKAAMEKKQADLDKKYADEKANIDYELAKQQAEIARDQAKREKALSIFQIAIDTAMSIAKTSATLGYPAAIPFVIAAGVLGALQTATVLATPLPEIPEPPKAARGRLIKGKSHRLGGEVVEAEAGEAIINKHSTSMFAPLLSAINEAGGGIPFTAPMSDGGYMYREAERGAPADVDAMSIAFSNAIKDLKIYTTMEDIRREDKKYADIESVTNTAII